MVFEKLFSKRNTFFKLKLREFSHEVRVDNCCKSRVALEVTAREVMTFFSFGDQHHFELHHTIFGDRCPEKWCSSNNAVAGVPRNLINWFFVPADKKVWGPLTYSLACLNFFQQSLVRIKSKYVNVAHSTE